MSGANTFTGGITLSSGGLYLAATNALGVNGTVYGMLTVTGNNTSISATGALGGTASSGNPIILGQRTSRTSPWATMAERR